MNTFIQVFFWVIIHIFGITETLNDRLLHDRICQHNLNYVDTADTNTLDSKTNIIISTNSMSQCIFHLMLQVLPLKVILYIATFHTSELAKSHVDIF